MKLHVRSVEHLEEVIDRFTPYGQTTTSIIQSSPVPRRGLELGADRELGGLARDGSRRPTLAARPSTVAQHDAADRRRQRDDEDHQLDRDRDTLNSTSEEDRRDHAKIARRIAPKIPVVAAVVGESGTSVGRAALRGSQRRPSVHLRRRAVTVRRTWRARVRGVRARHAPFYIGGFLGRSAAAWSRCSCRSCATRSTRRPRRGASIPAYLVPFAALQLVAGRSASGSGGAASCGPATSSTRPVAARRSRRTSASFLVVRALQGCANAFLTPLLLAGLADEVPPRQIGRAVGTFAAVQTAAVALAPLGGGALGAIDWRLAFVSQAVVAAGLALMPPADGSARDDRPAAARRCSRAASGC